MTIEELNVIITAQNEQFTKEMNEVQSQIKGLKTHSAAASKTMSNMFNLQMLTTGINLLKGAYASIVNMSKGYFDKIEQETKLAEVMRQRMNATASQITAIKKLTEQEQALGIVEDDVLMAGLQQLGTFSKYPDTLSTLNGAMANLIAQQKGYDATAQDAITIGNLMGKVLQGQTSALTRVGITFTEAQEEVLKYGNEQERAAMLAEVITDNVGNMNAALLNTPRGQLKQLQISLDDIKDSLTEGILAPLQAVLPTLNEVVSKGQSLARVFSGVMQGLFGKVNVEPVGAAVNANEDLAESVEAVNDAYKEGSSSIDEFNVASGFEDQGSEAEEIISNIGKETDIVSDSVNEAIQPMVDFIQNNKDDLLNMLKAIGVIVNPITRIATVIGIIVNSIKSNPEVLEGFTNMFNQIKEIAPDIMELLSEVGRMTSDIILVALQSILAIWQEAGPSILTVITSIAGVLSKIAPFIADISSVLVPIFTFIASGLSIIINGLESVGALEPVIWGIVAALTAWKIATIAQTAVQWFQNAALLTKIGLLTMGAGLVIAGVVGVASAAMAAKANDIPEYATGAVDIARGQLFVANENGPELVGTGPDGNAAVINNNQIVDIMASALTRKLNQEGLLGGGSQRVYVEVGFNTPEAARILKPYINYQGQRGV